MCDLVSTREGALPQRFRASCTFEPGPVASDCREWSSLSTLPLGPVQGRLSHLKQPQRRILLHGRQPGEGTSERVFWEEVMKETPS